MPFRSVSGSTRSLSHSLSRTRMDEWMAGAVFRSSSIQPSTPKLCVTVTLASRTRIHTVFLFPVFFFLPSLSCRLLLPDPLNSLCQQCGHLHARESILFLCLYVFSCIIFRSLCFRSQVEWVSVIVKRENGERSRKRREDNFFLCFPFVFA